MTRRNKIALAVVLAVVALLVGWALRPQPIAVELAEVARGAFEQVIADDGKTRVRDRYVIHAPLAGRVERIQLEVGGSRGRSSPSWRPPRPPSSTRAPSASCASGSAPPKRSLRAPARRP
jgi:HlyD family secretion protein